MGILLVSLPHAQMLYHVFSSVISRNILTHKDMSESPEILAVKSQLEGELPEVPAANGSTKTQLKLGTRNRPTGRIRGMLHADEM